MTKRFDKVHVVETRVDANLARVELVAAQRADVREVVGKFLVPTTDDFSEFVATVRVRAREAAGIEFDHFGVEFR